MSKKERPAAISLIFFVSHHLLYNSFLGSSPNNKEVQNFLGPQADACFGVTPVPNIGKSSALLMSGA